MPNRTLQFHHSIPQSQLFHHMRWGDPSQARFQKRTYLEAVNKAQNKCLPHLVVIRVQNPSNFSIVNFNLQRPPPSKRRQVTEMNLASVSFSASQKGRAISLGIDKKKGDAKWPNRQGIKCRYWPVEVAQVGGEAAAKMDWRR